MPSVLKKLCVLLFAFIFVSQAVAAGTDMAVPLETFVVIPNIGRPDVQIPIHDDGRDVKVGGSRNHETVSTE
jgi:hypothetical protein